MTRQFMYVFIAVEWFRRFANGSLTTSNAILIIWRSCLSRHCHHRLAESYMDDERMSAVSLIMRDNGFSLN